MHLTSPGQPLVSIITATYNTAPYLRETITSVLAQTYPNIEYIVLDDGSTDNTPAVLSEFRTRVQLHQHANMGEQRTVNKGFQLATGDYLIVVSADDPVKPLLVETLVAYMEAHPDVLVAYPGWEMIDSAGKVMALQPMYEYDYNILLRWHYCLAGPGSMLRRRALELEGGRDVDFRYTADYELWMRLGLHGPFAYVNQTLATWRYHANSTTVAVRDRRMAEEHFHLIEKLYRRKDLPQAVLAAKPEAMSTAYLVAASILMESDPSLAYDYLRQSFRYCPLAPRRYPSGLARPLRLLLKSFMPPVLRKRLP